MNIRSFTALSVTLIVLSMVILLLSVYQSHEIQDDISNRERQRFNSLHLANELFQSSEDLTRMARAYVITKNSIYKDNFHKILAIRNGQLPRPSPYLQTYWHLDGIGEASVVAGETIALVDLMRREGLSTQELALLNESQAKSNRLVGIEQQAFAAMEGLFDNGRGEYTVRGEPDSALAQKLLWSDEYAREKSKVMQPVEQFIKLLNERTQAELEVAQIRLTRQLLIQRTVLIIMLMGIIAGTFYIRRNILRPIENLTKQSRAIANGGYSARCTITGANEVTKLGKDFNQMAAAVEQAIMHYKQTEELLQHSEMRLKEAQHMAQIGNWELNLITGDLYWSDEVFRIFEMDQKLLVASYDFFLELVHPEDKKKVRQAFKNSLVSQESFEIKHRLLMSDGRVKWVNERGKVFQGVNGLPIRSAGTVQDITNRIYAERLKNEFIATVSHELRTPLTAIKGSLGLIQSGVTGALPDKVSHLIQIASQSCDRLILLVNDLLDIEKMEAGKMELVLRPHHLKFLLQQAIQENQMIANQLQVSLKWIDDFPDVMVAVDAGRMLQVFTNLLSNAIKFSPTHDEVIIKGQQKDRLICIMISNHGSGIGDDLKDKIFHKFFQGDSSDSRKKGGTGLGLAITKQLVDAMGGQIYFDSQPDVVTTFYVEFPIL